MSIRVMTAVWESAPFSQTALLVLLALADHANDDGECWPSIPRIADRARCKERRVRAIIAELERTPWLTCERTPGKVTRYIVTPVPQDTTALQDRGALQDRATPALQDTHPCPPVQGTPVPQDRGTTREPSREPSGGTTSTLTAAGLAPEEHKAFMRFLRQGGARSAGAVIAHLTKTGGLADRIAEFHDAANDAAPTDKQAQTLMREAQRAAQADAAAPRQIGAS